MARFGTPPFSRDPLAYADSRLSGVPTIDSNRDPTTDDTNYPIQTIWRNQNTFRECMLVGFTAGQAIWRCFTDGDGSVLELQTDDGNLVQPNGGVISVLGEAVLAGILSQPVYTNGATANTAKIQIQLGSAVSPTPVDFNSAGLLSANNNQFVVDATSGMFSLKGDTTNLAIQSISVDFNTAPGTNPVVASATGVVQVFGNVVTNATNANAPVATHSRAANQTHIDVQLTTAIDPGPADPYDVGLSSFNTKQFTADTNGNVSAKISGAQAPGFSNLAFQYVSGTGVFTIRGAEADLSATNYATVTLQSAADVDHLVTVQVTANQDFIDDNGASEIINNLFGLTTGVASAQACMFAVYAVLNDDEDAIAFMISRTPNQSTSPSVADIGAPDDAVADIATAFWSLENIDETLYDENPCLQIGSINMTMSALDDWTVGGWYPIGPGGNDAGIGKYGDGKAYVNALGQYGAASGKYFLDNGGTAPGFNGFNYNYYHITKPQMIQVEFDSGLNNVAGVGAVTARLALPYKIGPNTSTAHAYWTGGATFFDNSAGTYHNLNVNIPNNTQYAQFYLEGATAPLQNADFDASDRIFGAFLYQYTNDE